MRDIISNFGTGVLIILTLGACNRDENRQISILVNNEIQLELEKLSKESLKLKSTILNKSKISRHEFDLVKLDEIDQIILLNSEQLDYQTRLTSLFKDSLNYYVDYAFDSKEDNSDSIKYRIIKEEKEISNIMNEIKALEELRSEIIVKSAYRTQEDSVVKLSVLLDEIGSNQLKSDTCQFYYMSSINKLIKFNRCLKLN